VKPLPEAVQAAFPCAPDRLPSRPWWSKSNLPGESASFSRTDYRRAFVPTPRNLLSVEEVDEVYPLPHPGFRAGQVWAHESGESIVILRAISTRVWVSDNSKGDLPSEFARIYPYLMADPACPWLAPWSPSEVKP
jgi:hypothetical protein